MFKSSNGYRLITFYVGSNFELNKGVLKDTCTRCNIYFPLLMERKIHKFLGKAASLCRLFLWNGNVNRIHRCTIICDQDEGISDKTK